MTVEHGEVKERMMEMMAGYPEDAAFGATARRGLFGFGGRFLFGSGLDSFAPGDGEDLPPEASLPLPPAK
jgi:hypothetical protein